MSCPPTRTPVRYAAALRSRGRVADCVDDKGRGLARAFEPGPVPVPGQLDQGRASDAVGWIWCFMSATPSTSRATAPDRYGPDSLIGVRDRDPSTQTIDLRGFVSYRRCTRRTRSPDREPAAAVDHDLQRSGGRHECLGHRLRGPHSGSRRAPFAAVAQLHDASLEPGGVLVGSCAGREDRSVIGWPARRRAAHFDAVAGQHSYRSAARRTGQRCTTINSARPRRPSGVSGAVASQRRPPGEGGGVTPSVPEAFACPLTPR